jgi:hypothetical protein
VLRTSVPAAALDTPATVRAYKNSGGEMCSTAVRAVSSSVAARGNADGSGGDPAGAAGTAYTRHPDHPPRMINLADYQIRCRPILGRLTSEYQLTV